MPAPLRATLSSMPRWPTLRTGRSSHLIGSTSFHVAVGPTEIGGPPSRSEIMVEKLAGVARSRLRGGIGRLDRAALTAVERALLLVLGFA
jgi:mRNA-degrading endonuclease toxin of MazEF toxin-antitoxin module